MSENIVPFADPRSTSAFDEPAVEAEVDKLAAVLLDLTERTAADMTAVVIWRAIDIWLTNNMWREDFMEWGEVERERLRKLYPSLYNSDGPNAA